VTQALARVELGPDPNAASYAPPPSPPPMIESHPDPEPQVANYGMAETDTLTRVAAGVDPNDPTTWAATPRNAACPCGSGKKFKHCHGKTM